MPLRSNNTKHFHRHLYGGILLKIRLLKRDDNQRQGTVTAYTIFNCRKGQVAHTGETLPVGQQVGDRLPWFIPRSELERVGVSKIGPLDRIEELSGVGRGRVWAPLADDTITEKLFANYVSVDCQRIK